MHVATLISPADTPRLTEEMLRTLAGRCNARDLRWLAQGVAAELEIDAPLEDFDALWSGFQAQGIDLVQQPAEGRRKRVLLADMDSTMIGQECIDELAAEAGVGPRVAEITARAMNGELDFEAALRERVGLLAGLDCAVIDRVLATRISLAPGARELVATMRANGAYCALVSGGFTAFTSAVARQLGFHENRANTLLEENGKLTGRPGDPILGQQAKVDALHDICTTRGLTPDDVLAIGDGANDLGMLKLAGAGVAAHAKPVVAAQVSLRLMHADLRGALWLQGYRASEVTAG